MARMFPPSLPPAIRDEPKSRAEVHVYDALRDQTSRKWTAYYHVSWLGAMRTGGPPKDGEADFILTHPRFGVIVLEVKGGGIRYEGPRRQWFSRDRNGIEYEIDPINQVVRSKKVFLRKILDQTDWKSRWVQIAHAVVFPDVLATAVTLPTDLSPTIILDSSDLDRLERRLTEIALYFSKATPSDPYDDGPALVSVIERLLVPFVKFPTLGAEIEFTEKMLLKLTEEQYRLLDFLGGRRRAVIHGCAGSGKTIMAVEQARRFAELDGMKTILLCYEPHLAQDIAARLGTASDVRVQTFRDFCQHAIDPNKPCDPAADLDDLAERAIQVFDKSPESRYEAIVVDEGQDFEETWWVAIVSALSEQGVFYVFMDDNQRIKRSTAFPPIAPEHSFALHDNVRNTGTIFERMRSFYEGPTGARSRGPAGRPVAVKSYSSPDELRTTISDLLKQLISVERFAARDLVVLTTRTPVESPLAGLSVGEIRLTESPDSRSAGDVLFASIAGFKGLERPIVILVDLDDALLNSDHFHELCYVGFSRAKSHLILVGQQHVLPRLK